METGQVTQVRATVDCLNSRGPDERKRPLYNHQQHTHHLKRDTAVVKETQSMIYRYIYKIICKATKKTLRESLD